MESINDWQYTARRNIKDDLGLQPYHHEKWFTFRTNGSKECPMKKLWQQMLDWSEQTQPKKSSITCMATTDRLLFNQLGRERN